jgi:hypothetical protein
MTTWPQGDTAEARATRRNMIRGRHYRLTWKARALLHPIVHVNDCSARCTCGACVMQRLRKAGKLRRGPAGARA